MRGWVCVLAAAVLSACHLAASAVELAPDQSLQPASYTKYGLPSLNRAWTIEDYTAAATLLERVAAEQPLRLPRLSSPRSGPVFQRLIDPAHLDAVRDAQGSSLIDRAVLLNQYGTAMRRVSLAYQTAADKTGLAYLDEDFAFQLFSMRMMLASDQILGETLKHIPVGTADHATFMGHREDAREAAGKVLQATMTLLRLTRYSFSEERLRAMRDLQALAPSVYAIAPAETRAAVREQLEEMKENEADPMWRVCAATLDSLHVIDDPSSSTRARVIGSREASPNIIRGGR